MTGIFSGFKTKRNSFTGNEKQLFLASNTKTEVEEFFPIPSDEIFSKEDTEKDYFLPGEEEFAHLPTDMIVPSPGQPRRYFDGEALLSLSDSIKRYGILQPLSVTFDDECGKYILIAGERRLRAAKLLGIERVPAVIINSDPKQSDELSIIENIQRQNLNMFEEARAISSLLSKYGMTQENAAERLSVSQSYVANKLRLLKLSEEDAEEILSSGLTERHARALLRIKEPETRKSVIRQIISRRMNVAATEEYIDGILSKSDKTIEEKKDRQTVRMAVRDIKLFCNSIDRAVDTIKRAGIAVSTTRTDAPDRTDIVISIMNG